MALVALPIAGFVGFAYVRPVTVFEASRALRMRLAGIRSGDVQAGPYRLHYLQAGSGPPLVLVHGLASSAVHNWGPSMGTPGRRFHIYAPDLPGIRPPRRSYSGVVEPTSSS